MTARTMLMTGLFIFFLGSLFAQKEDFVWQVGYEDEVTHPTWHGTELNFNTEPVTVKPRPDGVSHFSASNTAISDAEGNLLFYTNGSRIYDRRHQVMENGSGLSPTPASLELLKGDYGQKIHQNVLILPWPQRDSLYYIMHHHRRFDMGFITDTFYYSVVDMQKNEVYGKVVEKNKKILYDPTLLRGHLTSCRHANGRDWWILARRLDTFGYYRFLLDSAGLHQEGIQQIGPEASPNGIGEAAFSPDGSRYVFMDYYITGGPIYLDLYNFDRCTGLLSNPTELMYQPDAELSGHGVVFSPNSRYLYASSTHYIHQFDVTAQDVQASKQIVAELGEFYCPETFLLFFNDMERAPDGKIYISGGGSHCHLSTIRYPDRRGAACEVKQHSLKLKTWNYKSVPDFPHFRLGPLDGSACDTLGIERPPVARFRDNLLDSLDPFALRFTDLSWYQPHDWSWTFGDGGTSTAQHPDHTYADTGRYEVCLTVTNEDGMDTHCDTVHVTDPATDVTDPQVNKTELTIYPVPARDQITIEGLEYGMHLTILNIQGQVVDRFEADGPVVEYEIGELAEGMYWLRTEEESEKFIKL